MMDERYFDQLMRDEGYCSNDAHDPGGETCFGISRVHHPGWVGWGTTNKKERLGMARTFYESEYWLDTGIPGLSNPLFNLSVNIGKSTAVKILQRIVVAHGVEIVIDGVFGTKTRAACRSVENIGDLFISMVEAHYVNLALTTPNMRRYLRGWLNRAKRLKKA